MKFFLTLIPTLSLILKLQFKPRGVILYIWWKCMSYIFKDFFKPVYANLSISLKTLKVYVYVNKYYGYKTKFYLLLSP